MADSKVMTYLKAREGQDVTVEQMLADGVAPNKTTLLSYLSKLVADPRTGVRRLGDAQRLPGVNRPYRYEPPPPPPEVVRLTFAKVGIGTAGVLVVDDEGVLYELRAIGQLEK